MALNRESKFVLRTPRPAYPSIGECQVFDFLAKHGMSGSFSVADPKFAKVFAGYSLPLYEVFEAAVEKLVTGEGIVAIRFKPAPVPVVMRFGIPLRPHISRNGCPIRLDRPDHFQVFPMLCIHDGAVVHVETIEKPLLIPAKDFDAVLEEPDLRLGCMMYRTSKK